jgi:hypothetical protein
MIPIVWYFKFLDVTSDKIVGNIYLWVLILTLTVGLLSRCLQIPLIIFKDVSSKKRELQQEVEGIISHWTAKPKPKRPIDKIHNSESDQYAESSDSLNSDGENKRVVRKRETANEEARYLANLRARENSQSDSEEDEKAAGDVTNKFVAKLTTKNKATILSLINYLRVFAE